MRWTVRASAVLAVVAVCVGVLVVGASDLAGFQRTVRDAGAWAPALFVLLQVLVTVPPVPRTVFTVAAGVLFGSVLGVVLAVLATVGAAVVAFWLVRLGTARLVARHVDRPAVAWVRARLDRSGTLAVLSLRLVPVVPFAVTNYAAGASGVGFGAYLFGTAVGVLPGTFAVVVLGDAAVGGAPPPALLAVSVTGGLLGLVGVVVAGRRPRPAGP